MSIKIPLTKHMINALQVMLVSMCPTLIVVFVLYLNFINEPHSEAMLFSSLIGLGVVIVFIPVIYLWLYMFGNSKTHEFTVLNIDNDGITYNGIFGKKAVGWSSYGGYKVTGIFHKIMTIRCSGSGDLRIGLGCFNRGQRTQILSVLDSYS